MLWSCPMKCWAFGVLCCLGLSIRELNDSPLATPCPLPRPTVSTAPFHSFYALIFPVGEPDHDVGLAGAERENAET